MKAPRIVSLLPSATEIVCALGAEELLVGRSHECDFPPRVRDLPAVTSARLSVHHESSGDVDRDVRRLVRDALSIYEIDVAALQRLQPDVIVTQDLCEVCAVSYDDVCRAARELGNDRLVIVNTHPMCLGDIWGDVRRVAHALDRDAAADRLLAELDQRVAAVHRRAAALDRPPVLAIEWLDPVMIGGMWSPELIELAGGTPLLARAGAHAETVTLAELRSVRPAPEVVLIKPCGFDIARTLRETAALQRVREHLPHDARVFVADGNALFNRPGPRIADSLEVLAACLHPAKFADLGRRHAEHCRPLSSPG